MAKQYLMDTNVAIDYIGGNLPQKANDWLDSHIDTVIYISVINKIEILGFQTETLEEMQPFEELVDTMKLINISDAIVNQTIILRKKYKIKLPDAIIAATALVDNLILLSANEKDFKRINGLQWQNLYKMV
jgi:predicted nucleic acid-binding protein